MKELVLFNVGLGNGGRYFACHKTKKAIASMIAQHENPAAFRRGEGKFFTDREYRHMTQFGSPCWGTTMEGITPEIGLWLRHDHCSKPTRLK